MDLLYKNENFTKIRKKLRLNQTEFSKKLDTSQDMISNYENKKIELPSKIIDILHKKLNIDIHWLLTGKGEMFLNSKKDKNSNIEIDEDVLDIFKVVYKKAVKSDKINLLEECLFECGQKIK